MNKIVKGAMTFFMCAGAMIISGLLYNHVHWTVGLAAIGASVYFFIQYRHWLFPE